MMFSPLSLFAFLKGKPVTNTVEIVEAAKTKAREAKVVEKVADPKRKVWVRCVIDSKPFADNKPLDYWQTYEISIHDALLLEDRKMAVILETPSN